MAQAGLPDKEVLLGNALVTCTWMKFSYVSLPSKGDCDVGESLQQVLQRFQGTERCFANNASFKEAYSAAMQE
ncbi:hypothetical protein AC249_AIPGENE14966 [Exaiptasia diaphana]|nr:hypothetical protein AC249_AIPGENE14966 [Exaiptasia diaphana]